MRWTRWLWRVGFVALALGGGWALAYHLTVQGQITVSVSSPYATGYGPYKVDTEPTVTSSHNALLTGTGAWCQWKADNSQTDDKNATCVPYISIQFTGDLGSDPGGTIVGADPEPYTYFVAGPPGDYMASATTWFRQGPGDPAWQSQGEAGTPQPFEVVDGA